VPTTPDGRWKGSQRSFVETESERKQNVNIEHLKEQLISDPEVNRLVAHRAFEIYLERRHRYAAHPSEDWLRAEREVLPGLISQMMERNRQAVEEARDVAASMKTSKSPESTSLGTEVKEDSTMKAAKVKPAARKTSAKPATGKKGTSKPVEKKPAEKSVARKVTKAASKADSTKPVKDSEPKATPLKASARKSKKKDDK